MARRNCEVGLRYVTIAAVNSKALLENGAAGADARETTSSMAVGGFNVRVMQG
jgi:hypothetical protein